MEVTKDDALHVLCVLRAGYFWPPRGRRPLWDMFVRRGYAGHSATAGCGAHRYTLTPKGRAYFMGAHND